MLRKFPASLISSSSNSSLGQKSRVPYGMEVSATVRLLGSEVGVGGGDVTLRC